MTDHQPLRERIIAGIAGTTAALENGLTDWEVQEIADAVLSLPEIADALKLKVVKPLNLGPSISTNKRTPV